jgi:hypothetical protein
MVDQLMPVGAAMRTSGVTYGDSGPVGVVTFSLLPAQLYGIIHFMITMKMHKDLKPVAAVALHAGWKITRGGTGHLLWRSPDGQIVVTASSPSKRRGRFTAATAAKAQLRRAGLAVLHRADDVV